MTVRILSMGKWFSVFFSASILSLSLSTAWAAEDVAERIKPVGKSCMEGQPCAAAVVAASFGTRTGEELYTAKCSLCHGAGVLGAPKFGDASAWGPRIAERKLEGLYEHAIKGFNAMPPKGTCADCSDDEIKGAVKYMVDKAK
ncbi:MAG TPA: cytochrome c5 family protein [Cellvibrionaceae bacterium]